MKLRDKKRNSSITEDEYSHPRHEPYRREHKNPQQWLDETESDDEPQEPDPITGL